MAFILTRINVGDYERWKPMFDQDTPGARAGAKGHRLLRSVENPNEVFVLVEFDSTEEANVGREKLLASGVLGLLIEFRCPEAEGDAETFHERASIRRCAHKNDLGPITHEISE